MEKNKSLGYKECASLLALLLLTKFIFITPQLMVAGAGSAAWMTVVAEIAAAFFFMGICVRLSFTRVGTLYPEKPWFSFVKYLALFFCGIYFFVMSAAFLNQYLIGAVRVSLPDSPEGYLMLFCMAAVGAVGRLGLDATVRGAKVLLLLLVPISLISFGVLLRKVDLCAFTPVWGRGASEALVKTPLLYWLFPELVYGYALLPRLSSQHSAQKMSRLAIAGAGVGFLMSMLAYLINLPSSLAGKIRFPTHQMVFLLEGGTAFESIKPFFTFIWYTGIFLYCGTSILFMAICLKRLLGLSDHRPPVVTLTLMLIMLSLVMGSENEAEQVMVVLLHYGGLVFPAVPLVLSCIQKITQRRKKDA